MSGTTIRPVTSREPGSTSPTSRSTASHSTSMPTRPGATSCNVLARASLIAVADRRGPGPAAGRRPAGRIWPRRRPGGARPSAARLHIGNDGIITVMTGKVECGQGARAELTQAAAEELGVAPGAGPAVMADTSLTPDDGVTAGSESTPSDRPRRPPGGRRGAAAARPRRPGRGASTPAPSRCATARPSTPRRQTRMSYADLASDDDAPRPSRPRSARRRPRAGERLEGARHVGRPAERPRPGDRSSTGSRPTSSGPGCSMARCSARRPTARRCGRSTWARARAIEGVVVVQDSSSSAWPPPRRSWRDRPSRRSPGTAEVGGCAHPSSQALFDHLRQHARGGRESVRRRSGEAAHWPPPDLPRGLRPARPLEPARRRRGMGRTAS